MATLKELMGGLTRGDGRKFKLSTKEVCEFFEPIFLGTRDGCWYGVDELGNSIIYVDQNRRDWEPYIEPKKKIEMWKWAFKSANGWEDTQYYMAEEDGNWLSASKVAVKIEGSRIEVDE